MRRHTVKKPDSRVVRAEAKDHVSIGAHEDGITAHGNRGRRGGVVRVVDSSIVLTSGNKLEGMAVKMERMLARVVVVEDDLDDFVLPKDKGVGVASVNNWIGGVGASRKNSVEGWHLWSNVGDIVEECTTRCQKRLDVTDVCLAPY